MTILIQPLDEEATDAQAPLDAWLEQSVRDSCAALLAGPHVASSAWDGAYQRIWDRVDGSFFGLSALYSYRPAIIAQIPLRLPVGTDQIVLTLAASAVIQTDPAGTPRIRLAARLLSEIRDVTLASVPGIVTLAPGDDDVYAITIDLARPLQLERVDDLVLLMQCEVDSASWGDLVDVRARARAITRTVAGAFGGADEQLGPDNALLLRAGAGAPALTASQWIEPANSPDLATVNEQYDELMVYDDLTLAGSETNLRVDAYAMPGLELRAIEVAIRRDVSGLIPDRARLRAGVVVEGAAHAALEELVQATQDQPRLLMPRSRGDVLIGELRERRPWRVATLGLPVLLEELVWVDRDYGTLEVQIRMIAVSWDQEGEVEAAGLWGGAAEMGATLTPALASEARVVVHPVRPRGPGRALRDLARYYGPDGQNRALDRPGESLDQRTGQGYRAGQLLQEELGLVSVAVVRVPVPIGHDVDLPLRVRVEIDPTDPAPDGSVWRVASQIHVCGASITWDGRP